MKRHIHYLNAGINDWGGISPVTIDFINPQHEWPEIRQLAQSCAQAGYQLQERLTIYPKFHISSDPYLDEGLRARVAQMSRTDGLARSQFLEEIS